MLCKLAKFGLRLYGLVSNVDRVVVSEVVTKELFYIVIGKQLPVMCSVSTVIVSDSLLK